MSGPLQIGVIGCGSVAVNVHLPRLAALEELFRVRSLCDLHGDRIAAAAPHAPDARRTSSVEELLDDGDLDAVAVLTPLHGAILAQVLNRGLDAFVEKPLCEDPVTARALVERARRSQAVVKVGTMREHDPAITRARALLPSLGRIRWVELRDACGRGEPGGPEPVASLQAAFGDATSQRERNALQTASLQLVHDLSILRALFDPELEIAHMSVSNDGWTLCGQLTMNGSIPVQLSVAEYGVARRPGFDQTVTVVGEAGTLSLSFDDPVLPERPTLLRRTGHPPESFVLDAYRAEWRDFHAAIATRHVEIGQIGRAADDVDLLWRIARS